MFQSNKTLAAKSIVKQVSSLSETFLWNLFEVECMLILEKSKIHYLANDWIKTRASAISHFFCFLGWFLDLVDLNKH
jgi:hypothetical protein